MRMARSMCDISLSDGSAIGRISNEQMRAKLGTEHCTVHIGPSKMYSYSLKLCSLSSMNRKNE